MTQSARAEVMTVYLVWIGDYSDKSVCAAFSTEAAADVYAERVKGSWVEDLEMDPEWVERGHQGFEVFVTTDGDVEAVEKLADLSRSSVDRTDRGYWVKCFAKNAEHAKKIATEKRQEAMAKAAGT